MQIRPETPAPRRAFIPTRSIFLASVAVTDRNDPASRQQQSWRANAAARTQAVREQQIESRRLATDSAMGALRTARGVGEGRRAHSSRRFASEAPAHDGIHLLDPVIEQPGTYQVQLALRSPQVSSARPTATECYRQSSSPPRERFTASAPNTGISRGAALRDVGLMPWLGGRSSANFGLGAI
jgi:hypothetical protein